MVVIDHRVRNKKISNTASIYDFSNTILIKCLTKQVSLLKTIVDKSQKCI